MENTTGRGITLHASIIWSSTIAVLFGRSNQAACQATFPRLIQEIAKSLYVDDLVSGGPTLYAVQKIKEGAIDVFG